MRKLSKDWSARPYYEAVQTSQLTSHYQSGHNPVSMKQDENWSVKATACESPEVKLGDYKNALKGLRAKAAIWTPDKAAATTPAEDKTKTQGPTLEQIFEELLKTVTVDNSDLLVESETNRLLSQFVDPGKRRWYYRPQYLESKGKSQDQLKAEYRETADKTLKLEFTIAKIAEDNQITVTDHEVDEMIAKTQDEYAKKALQTTEQKAYLALLLRKQKTLTFSRAYSNIKPNLKTALRVACNFWREVVHLKKSQAVFANYG